MGTVEYQRVAALCDIHGNLPVMPASVREGIEWVSQQLRQEHRDTLADMPILLAAFEA